MKLLKNRLSLFLEFFSSIFFLRLRLSISFCTRFQALGYLWRKVAIKIFRIIERRYKRRMLMSSQPFISHLRLMHLLLYNSYFLILLAVVVIIFSAVFGSHIFFLTGQTYIEGTRSYLKQDKFKEKPPVDNFTKKLSLNLLKLIQKNI